MCRSYNRQYGTRFLRRCRRISTAQRQLRSEGAHVLPALVRKMHEAKAAASIAW